MQTVLDLQDFEKYSNTANELTQIASFRIPRGYVAEISKLDPLNLYLPRRETVEHAGNGEETLSLSGDIVDGALSDDLTVKVMVASDGSAVSGSVGAIDYSANEITVTHDTNEDLYIYYLAGSGQVEINAYKPTGGGLVRENLFTKSIKSIHTINQDEKESMLTIQKNWILPPAHLIKVEVNASWVVRFLQDNDDLSQGDYTVGEIEIPLWLRRVENFDQKKLDQFNSRYAR